MKRIFLPILLVLVSALVLGDFFHPGLPLTHDGKEHIARVASFYQAIKEGQLIPRWAGNLNWGYGHPLFIFFYPLPYYLASFFHFLGFSLVTNTKLVFGLSFVFSGLFMYLWLKELWGSWPALVGAVFYLLAPYRLVDLYVRGALGECWGFVWPPLIGWLVLKLKTDGRYFFWGALAVAGLILSHQALSLMFLPLLLVYSFLIAFTLPKPKRLSFSLQLGLLFFFGLGLSAFFWLPAVFEAKYTLRDIVTKDNIAGFENFGRLLWSSWSYGGTGTFSVQIGPWHWLSVLAGPIAVWRLLKQKNKYWWLPALCLVFFLLAILMILPFSRPLYFKIPFLQKFQFAWRFLALAALPPAILASASFFILSPKARKIFGLVVIFGLLLTSWSFRQAKDYFRLSDSYFERDYPSSTNDTGETAPIWSIRSMEEFPRAPYGVIKSEAEIKPIFRSFVRHKYLVKATAKTRIVDNTLYFPGWQVWVEGKRTVIEWQDPDFRGLITFWVPEGENTVEVKFGETKLRKVANLLSLTTILVLILALAVVKWKQKR